MEYEEGDVVHWAPHGFAFVVTDQDKFLEEIVPRYFKHTKLTSFQRQLNLYGFRRLTKGEDQGAYFHPKFQRGRKDLIPEIKRLPPKGSLPTLEQVMNSCKQLPSERYGGVRNKNGQMRTHPAAFTNTTYPVANSYGGVYMNNKYHPQMGMFGPTANTVGGNSDTMNNFNGYNPYMMNYSGYTQMNPYYSMPQTTATVGESMSGYGDVRRDASNRSGNETFAPYTKSKLTMNIGFSNGQFNPGAARVNPVGVDYTYNQQQFSGGQQYRLNWPVPTASNFSNESLSVPAGGDMYQDPNNPAIMSYYINQSDGVNPGKEEQLQSVNSSTFPTATTAGANDKPARNDTFEEIDKLGILDVFAPENSDQVGEQELHSLKNEETVHKEESTAASIHRTSGYVPSFDEAMGATIQSPKS